MTPLFDLLSKDEIRAAEILGKAMRFGAMFAIDDPSDAGELIYLPEKGRLELKLTPMGRQLSGEVAEARFKSLCNSLNAEPVIKI